MDEINRYPFVSNCPIKSKKEAFEWIGETALNLHVATSKEDIVKELYQREQVGSTQIAEQVLLPHLESSAIQKSQMLFIYPESPIEHWNEEITDIRLIIVILLKQNETLERKKEISSFVRHLADEDFIEKLVAVKTEDEFIQQIKEN